MLKPRSVYNHFKSRRNEAYGFANGYEAQCLAPPPFGDLTRQVSLNRPLTSFSTNRSPPHRVLASDETTTKDGPRGPPCNHVWLDEAPVQAETKNVRLYPGSVRCVCPKRSNDRS